MITTAKENISDRLAYEFLQQKQFTAWEAACLRCGACCGAFDSDQCEYLTREKDGAYYCAIYENRFGVHATTGGKPFRCVPLRDILHQSWPGDLRCIYKKQRNSW